MRSIEEKSPIIPTCSMTMSRFTFKYVFTRKICFLRKNENTSISFQLFGKIETIHYFAQREELSIKDRLYLFIEVCSLLSIKAFSKILTTRMLQVKGEDIV